MFSDLGQRLVNESNLLFEDKAHVFKNLIKEYNTLADWNQIEECINYPHLYDFELIDSLGNKIEIPRHQKAWTTNKLVQDKQFIAEHVNKGNGLIITNYDHKNKEVTTLCGYLEEIFDIHCSAHLYCGLEDSRSFWIHEDYPSNIIIQVEGTTRWRIFKNRISSMYKTGTMNGQLSLEDLEIEIDTILEPGDVLYIPSRAYHLAEPKGERISISIPCWTKLPTDLNTVKADRNFYSIRRK